MLPAPSSSRTPPKEMRECGHRDPIEDTGGGVAHQSEDPVSNPVEKLKTAGPTCQYEATPGEVFGSTQGGGKGGPNTINIV